MHGRRGGLAQGLGTRTRARKRTLFASGLGLGFGFGVVLCPFAMLTDAGRCSRASRLADGASWMVDDDVWWCRFPLSLSHIC